MNFAEEEEFLARGERERDKYRENNFFLTNDDEHRSERGGKNSRASLEFLMLLHRHVFLATALYKVVVSLALRERTRE